MNHRNLHIDPSPDASVVLQRVQQRIQDSAVHELTYTLFTSLLHEWAEGLNRAEFTLAEVWAILVEGLRGQSAREITADMCSIDVPLDATPTFGADTPFRRKLQRLTRHERCGLAFILNESWLAPDKDEVAVLKRFKMHGVSFRA